MVSGTITVKHDGDKYDIVFDTVDDMGFSIKGEYHGTLPNSQTVATKYISALEVSGRQYHRQHICQKNRGQRIIFDQWIILQNREQADHDTSM